MTPTPLNQTKARWILLALTAVFLIPLALAWMFTVGPFNWRPLEMVNQGLLLQPPLHLNSHGVTDASGPPLVVDTNARNWYLVVLHNSACNDSCQLLFQTAERIRVAVGRDRERVYLASLGPDKQASFLYGQSWVFPAEGDLVEVLRHSTGEDRLNTGLLIVDFQGYIVLIYPSIEDGYGTLNGLMRLLKATAG